MKQPNSLKSSRVIWILNHLVNRYGCSKCIRMDNGPEFEAKLMHNWSEANAISFKYIQPGKPMQNAYIERFNKSYRVGLLDAYLLVTKDEVREITAVWVEDYNKNRPYDALGGLSPLMHRQQQTGAVGLRYATPPTAIRLHYAQQDQQH